MSDSICPILILIFVAGSWYADVLAARIRNRTEARIIAHILSHRRVTK